MVSFPHWLQRRLFSTHLPKNHQTNSQWNVKQVTKSNFTNSLEEVKSHISTSDFIAVSLQKTGSFSSPWHRVSPFDTADTAYLKAKHVAERFQVLQFAVCPFTVRASKITAYPYNFHLFPRDELNIGMPSYSFSCQTSYLTSMAREGFDFNACIYDGISYLSKAQESAAEVQMGNPILANRILESTSISSAADEFFIQRTKSRVKHWRNACTDSGTKADGTEEHNSRPCMNIDVCSERQVQLVIEMLQEFSDDLVPLIVPAKGGGTQAIRVVLARSKEDRDLLQNELQNLKEEHNKKVRGFREVIDLISSSQKPVVSHNSLNDLTFIYSKFLAPLPANIEEFMHSLHLAFPQVIDVNHLMREISPLKKLTNIPMAISYLKNRFFAPVDVEVPFEALVNEGKTHGRNVVRICQLFAKLCYVLKLAPNSIQSDDKNLPSALEAYSNIFTPYTPGPQEPTDEDIRIWTNSTRKVSCEDLVFLWGFRDGMSAGLLKSLLQESHKIFSEEFDVKLVDKSCAIVVFWQRGMSKTFLDVLNNSPEIFGPLREMISEGARAASYDTYYKGCRLALWDANLADSLDKALADRDSSSEADSKTKSLDTYWCSEWMINLDDL
ncbi:poly(A)-specific ribonuclease PARN-like isoform X2 [Jatropha curcas]|uniref:poly(A)-specific ribonuclease PARN-like isoform X2 n=1 Tax=Jatropha curcas TaxID=180498 RepID=UPI0009D63DC7|nr:poly(A)-specific ribonuclease PARN-like isoform X2 [Jatropha curcas]